MNEDELFSMRSELEKRFEEVLKKGEDVRLYLYYPQALLSEKVKGYLDDFLLKEAYDYIEKETFNVDKFIVYKDPLVTIKLEKKDQKVELLERLISYFLPKEEYEKCSKVQKILNTIQNESR